MSPHKILNWVTRKTRAGQKKLSAGGNAEITCLAQNEEASCPCCVDKAAPGCPPEFTPELTEILPPSSPAFAKSQALEAESAGLPSEIPALPVHTGNAIKTDIKARTETRYADEKAHDPANPAMADVSDSAMEDKGKEMMPENNSGNFVSEYLLGMEKFGMVDFPGTQAMMDQWAKTFDPASFFSTPTLDWAMHYQNRVSDLSMQVIQEASGFWQQAWQNACMGNYMGSHFRG